MNKGKYSKRELSDLFKHALKQQESGNFPAADKSYNKILSQIPNHADSLHYLGLSKYQQGKSNEAIMLINSAISYNPNDIEMQLNMALILSEIRQFRIARDIYIKIVTAAPNLSIVHNNLSQIYNKLGEESSYVYHCNKAYELDPDNPIIMNAYANLLMLQFKFVDAIEVLKSTLEKDPESKIIVSNLISNLFNIGDFENARLYTEKMENQRSNNAQSANQNLFYSNYDSRLGSRDISLKHIKRAQLFPTLFCPRFPTDNISSELNNMKSSNRKRRIAYVSADFRFHSVAFFILPILRNHKSENFEVYCYSNSNKNDDYTNEFKKLSQHWRDIADLNDDEVVQLTINDKIDILIDLSGYSAGSRLGVFANRVAPLQISYLGYPNTTGLTTVDYRITDYYTDPVGLTEHLSTEKLARLDDVFLCFSPQSGSPPVSKPPFEKNGFITFGSFNNMAKINDDVIKIWSELLLNFTNSKLLLKSKALADPDVQQFILSRFKKYGISNERILLKSYANDFVSHVSAYSDMDIALDTFPYNGTTTTCEALWMGVPVITLLGNSHISRVSASILHKLELDDFIAHSNEDYINIACKLATDKHVLPNLRSTMRERMQNSGFISGIEFTKNLEKLYQKIWQERMRTIEMTCAY